MEHLLISQLLEIAQDIRADLLKMFLQFASEDRQEFPFRVHGISLEVDRYWIASFLHKIARRPWPIDPFSHAFFSRHSRPNWDMNYRPDDWHDYCKGNGFHDPNSETLPSPIRLRAYLEPTRLFSPTKATPSFTLEKWPTSFATYPIVYEVTPRASAVSLWPALSSIFNKCSSSRASVSIGQRDPLTAGTLGGYLALRNSPNMLAVSCAHVLGVEGTELYSPGPYEGQQSEALGYVRKHWIADLKKERKPCSWEYFPDACGLDLAVAEVTRATMERYLPFPFHIDEVRPTDCMEQDSIVTFCGKESGFVEARISGVSIWKEMETNQFGTGQSGIRCFGNLFELMSPRGDTKRVAQHGDSGAWIVDDDTSMRRWNGILIGVQGRRAIASFASHAMRSIQSLYPDVCLA